MFRADIRGDLAGLGLFALMIEDFSDHAPFAVFNAQVAIVGAGAAGITLARRLAAANIQVCLLENGGRDYEQPVQDLAKGGLAPPADRNGLPASLS